MVEWVEGEEGGERNGCSYRSSDGSGSGDDLDRVGGGRGGGGGCLSPN